MRQLHGENGINGPPINRIGSLNTLAHYSLCCYVNREEDGWKQRRLQWVSSFSTELSVPSRQSPGRLQRGLRQEQVPPNGVIMDARSRGHEQMPDGVRKGDEAVALEEGDADHVEDATDCELAHTCAFHLHGLTAFKWRHLARVDVSVTQVSKSRFSVAGQQTQLKWTSVCPKSIYKIAILYILSTNVFSCCNCLNTDRIQIKTSYSWCLLFLKALKRRVTVTQFVKNVYFLHLWRTLKKVSWKKSSSLFSRLCLAKRFSPLVALATN